MASKRIQKVSCSMHEGRLTGIDLRLSSYLTSLCLAGASGESESDNSAQTSAKKLGKFAWRSWLALVSLMRVLSSCASAQTMHCYIIESAHLDVSRSK